jgi:1-acyl-sn-glycerol-3-phosphate acyltransferase
VSLHYSATRFLLGGFVGALSGWEVHGREHVPKSGAVIVASNHISFWDPLLVGTAAIREQHFLAKGSCSGRRSAGSSVRSTPFPSGVASRT